MASEYSAGPKLRITPNFGSITNAQRSVLRLIQEFTMGYNIESASIESSYLLFPISYF